MIKRKIKTLLKDRKVDMDEDVLEYGLNIFDTYLKYLALIIPLSVILGSFAEVLIFIILFIPLRRYIGGFHFDNLNYCFIGSVALAILLPHIANSIFIPSSLVIIIAISTILFTVCIGAVDHNNKLLTVEEKRKHTKKALLIELTYIIVIVLAYTLNLKYVINIITLILLFCIGGIGILILRRK